MHRCAFTVPPGFPCGAARVCSLLNDVPRPDGPPSIRHLLEDIRVASRCRQLGIRLLKPCVRVPARTDVCVSFA